VARSRFIKPEFFDDSSLAKCSHAARLLFIACWQISDRLGIFEWDLPKIRKYAFGYEEITLDHIVAMFAELLAGGHVERGQHENRNFGRVPNLVKHQRFHKDEHAKYIDIPDTVWCQHHLGTTLAPPEHHFGTTPNALNLSIESENGELRTENREVHPAPFFEKASDALEELEQRPKEIRSTRGFPEAAFEAELIENGRSAGYTVAAFDSLERSIAGKIIKRCGVEKITQARILAEWWRPEWRVWHGFTVKDLDRHFAKVRAALADPKMRPRPKRDAANDPPPGYRPMPSDEENARMLAERSAPIDPKQFAEVSALMRKHVEKM